MDVGNACMNVDDAPINVGGACINVDDAPMDVGDACIDVGGAWTSWSKKRQRIK